MTVWSKKKRLKSDLDLLYSIKDNSVTFLIIGVTDIRVIKKWYKLTDIDSAIRDVELALDKLK